jgi:peptide alpha-N-acetyltransferase
MEVAAAIESLTLSTTVDTTAGAGDGTDTENSVGVGTAAEVHIDFVDYTDESMLPEIQRLIAADLSEPYSIFTYRFFLHQWPTLCICVFLKDDAGVRGEMIGTIVCKAEPVRDVFQGYIAMLTVSKQYRKLGIGKKVI